MNDFPLTQLDDSLDIEDDCGISVKNGGNDFAGEYQEMSLAARREANIAKNNMWLQASGLLDIRGKGSLAPGNTGTEGSNRVDSRRESSKTRVRAAVSITLAISRLKKHFPERQNEINTIMHHLDPHFTPAPPLMLFGSPGSGKTCVVRACQTALEAPYCYFDCGGFASPRQLVRALFLDIANGLFPGLYRADVALQTPIARLSTDKKPRDEGDIERQGSEGFEYDENSAAMIEGSEDRAVASGPRAAMYRRLRASVKLPGSFSDLCESVCILLRMRPFDDKDEEKSTMTQISVTLDSVFLADKVESGLTERLLQLSNLAHPQIKVIGVVRHLSRIPSYVLPLAFPAYSDEQLKRLVVRMVACAVPILPLNSHHRDAEQPLPSSAVSDKQNVVDTCETAVGRLLRVTRHPTELWIACYQLHRDRVAYVGQLKEDIKTAATVSSGSIASSVDATQLRNRWREERLGAAVATMFHQPSLLYSLASSIPPARTDSTAAANSSRTTHERGRVAARGGLHSKGFDESTRGLAWCDSLSRATKYLMLAAYIASHNKSDTDYDVLGAGSKGKRKRTRRTSANGAAGEIDENKENSGRPGGRSFLLDRMFCIFMTIAARSGANSVLDEGAASHERRGKARGRMRRPIPPVTQMCGAADTIGETGGEDVSPDMPVSSEGGERRRSETEEGDKGEEQRGEDANEDEDDGAENTDGGMLGEDPLRFRIARDYGDTQLFSTVTMLTNMGFLASTPGWNLSQPSYVCSFDKTFALDVAKNLKFPLNDYLA